MELGERKMRILRAVVEDYVETGEPVGSRAVARRHDIGVSPATIRNEMADLEEMGYLLQPHTSAGRIPSDRGYRYYVDKLMPVTELREEDLERLRLLYQQRTQEIEDLIKQTVQVLARTTNYMAVVMGPQLAEARLSHISLAPLTPYRAVLVLVTDSGFLESALLTLPHRVSGAELEHISSVLNKTLCGLTLDQITRQAWRELERELARFRAVLERMLEFFERSLRPFGSQRMYLAGTANILTHPEFRDVDRVRMILRTLEQEDLLARLMGQADAAEDEVTVTIGVENPIEEVRDCSIVTATYRIGPRVVGRMGVLGPKRMRYAQVIAVVSRVRQMLTQAFMEMVS